jgi:hypothetical protein
MSADRIEYNLHQAFVGKYLDLDEIRKIINDLRFERNLILENGERFENVWFFVNQVSAKKFGMIPLILSQTLISAPFNGVVYKLFSDLIKYCFKNNIIQLYMFHFGKDTDILEILNNSNDITVKKTLKKLKNINKIFKKVELNDEFDFEVKNKFRGIDPWIMNEGKLVFLSQIDKDFKNYFLQTRVLLDKHYIKMIND